MSISSRKWSLSGNWKTVSLQLPCAGTSWSSHWGHRVSISVSTDKLNPTYRKRLPEFLPPHNIIRVFLDSQCTHEKHSSTRLSKMSIAPPRNVEVRDPIAQCFSFAIGFPISLLMISRFHTLWRSPRSRTINFINRGC